MSTNSILSQMPIDLGDNLILRFARPNDVDALAEFNARVFEDEKVGVGIRGLMSGHHPTVKASDFTVVEDARTNKIVSSMCLISQMWAYCGIPFKFGRPEVVVTEPEYRRRGLVRKQFEVIHALSASRDELMQGITGIPWYYRQFGYEMAMEVDGGRAIAGIDLPKLKDGDSEKYHLRPVVDDDHAFIRELYDCASCRQPFSTLRSEAEWNYEFGGRSENDFAHWKWLIIETAARERLGYVQYYPWIEDNALYIVQMKLKSGVGYLNLMPSVLQGLWKIAQAMPAYGNDKNKELKAINLELGRTHPAYHALLGNKIRVDEPYGLYIRVPDLIAFLRHIRPALEKNLVGTVAEGYNGELKLNYYRSGIQLKFNNGKIMDISNWSTGSVEDGDARFPDLTFLQLLCGRLRFNELKTNFVDCGGRDEAGVLLDCLFPPFTGNIWCLS
ncbi:GNAT family N-acetyltransferase [Candidatus Poribacteria bacterium]|nr:GNAT family N-acetyltransferase [Candidatus Poribacteria bacterium]